MSSTLKGTAPRLQSGDMAHFTVRYNVNSISRSRMAGDWADYALDRQKRLDPNTGKTSKDSSLYSYTWVDAFGQHYQANDMNDNPNGRLKGSWTLQQNVH